MQSHRAAKTKELEKRTPHARLLHLALFCHLLQLCALHALATALIQRTQTHIVVSSLLAFVFQQTPPMTLKTSDPSINPQPTRKSWISVAI